MEILISILSVGAVVALTNGCNLVADVSMFN